MKMYVLLNIGILWDFVQCNVAFQGCRSFQKTFFLLVHVRETTTSRIDMVMIQFGTCISLEISSLELYITSPIPRHPLEDAVPFPNVGIFVFSPWRVANWSNKSGWPSRQKLRTQRFQWLVPASIGWLRMIKKLPREKSLFFERVSNSSEPTIMVQWKMDVSPR